MGVKPNELPDGSRLVRHFKKGLNKLRKMSHVLPLLLFDILDLTF